ncbi:NAD-dependent protein deacetylase of SIR2 family [Indibacter alkaliphilus LW1]|uniref:NAD-dependent protein deacylase n=1 Tax=Indibacter alkaliphilus (strain CCUG 57479 / KCTC 22604 / LW1) TaxID=1189612 RepID=S2E2I9_INDAL|nr:NAD-dependent deacylase [Indibacter alkaliphilus]EOZ98686.1 NAD-dependent protein deacetylase of SIR2 family [Indibacter alkaliphilus LW1]
MKKLVVLTGAGISAESGISTFRDSGGLWEGHDIMEVASPDGWRKNKELVLDFYNKRRKQALTVMPNEGHKELASLEKYFEVTIITQNVDNLHERAGSKNVIHLHGELFKSQSTLDPSLIYDVNGWEIKLGDKCEKGSQLRPFIVWFGELVPKIEPAIEIAKEADIFAVIGTSLLVYPAAGLIQYAPSHIPKYIIDVNIPQIAHVKNLRKIEAPASIGTKEMAQELIEKYAK